MPKNLEKSEIGRLKKQVVELGMKLEERNFDVRVWKKKYEAARVEVANLTHRLEKEAESSAELQAKLAVEIAKNRSQESRVNRDLSDQRDALRGEIKEQARRQQWLDDFIESTKRRRDHFA